MTTRLIAATVVLFVACGPPRDQTAAGVQAAQASPLPTGTLDQLLAPIALYPDQLLAQMLMSATDPAKITELDKWLKANQTLKGTQLQDAAVKAGFDASFVALALFPQVVAKMADQIAWTRVLGQAFTSDRNAVFASIQKLRLQAKNVGTLKSSPQQEVETKTTSSGQEVIVIEPTNPQIVYVPQYNTEVVYTQAPTTVVVVQEDNDADVAVAAGLIGFTAGIAIGAAMDNNYYYGPYGWHGGGYMYNDAWDDYYDASGRRSRGLAGSPRGPRRGARRSRGEPIGAADRARLSRPRSSARTVNRRGRKIDLSRRRNERSGARRRHKALRPRARRHRHNVRVAQEVPKPAVTARETEVRQRLNGAAAARTHSRDIRADDHNAPPVLVDNRAEAARAARAAGAAAGERFEEVDTHDQDDRYESIRQRSRTHAPQSQRSSVRVCVAGASRIIGDRRGTDRDAPHVCHA